MGIVRVAALAALLAVAAWESGFVRFGGSIDRQSSAHISGRTVVLRAGSEGKVVALRAGDALTVELEGQPGTGFRWEVLDPLPPGLRRDANADTEPSSSSKGQVGGVQLQHFHFTAEGRGSGTLKLGYRRAWETAVDPTRRFDVEIVIE